MFSGPEDAGEVVSSGLFPAMVALALGAANLIYTWWARNQTVAADKVTKIETRLDGMASAERMKAAEDRIDKVEDRQISVEEQMKHLPTKDDVLGLKVQLADALGQIGSQSRELSSVARIVNRIDDYLREKA